MAAAERARQEEYKKLLTEASEGEPLSASGVSCHGVSSSAAGPAREAVATANPEGEDVKKINWKQMLMQVKDRALQQVDWESKLNYLLKEKEERDAREARERVEREAREIREREERERREAEKKARRKEKLLTRDQ